MKVEKPWVGFLTVAVLIVANVFFSGFAATEALADPMTPSCQEPEDECECFGNVCVDDFPGFDRCLAEWHGGILDPINDEGGEPTGYTCKDPN